MADPRINVSIGADSSEFKTEMTKVSGTAGQLASQFKKIAGVAGIAFGAKEIGRAAIEMGKLAASAEGVKNAFLRIGDPALLMELQDATKGTVSELELMKRAVQASNFQIPLENLGSLLKFASKRAQETGESVDYLVQSIILGIGRKSPLILDNLGISAVRLKEELKGVGTETATVADIAASVGKIAADEMKKSGDIIETNAIKLQQLNAEWENMRVLIGEKIAPALGALADAAGDAMSRLTFDSEQFGLKSASKDVLQLKESLKGLTGDEALTVIAEKYQDIKERLKQTQIEKDNVDKSFSNDILLNAVASITPAYKKARTNQEFLNSEIIRFKNILLELEPLLKQTTKSLDETFNPNHVADAEKTVSAVANAVYSAAMMPDQAMIEDNVNDFVDKFGSALSNKISKVETEAEKFNKAFGDALIQGMTDVTIEFASLVGELAVTGDAKGFGKGLLKTMGSFMKQMGSFMIAYGIANSALAEALKQPGNPVAAATLITAGAALVAIGSAISAAAAKGPKSSSGASYAGSSGGGYSSGSITSQQQAIRIYGQLQGRDITLSSNRGSMFINSMT